jgi:hypothetical protein
VNRDWFYQLLKDNVAAYNDVEAEARLENFRRDHPEYEEKEFVRRWVEFRLRKTGVVYGTPLASEDAITHARIKGYSQRWAAFLAILRIEADLSLDVGCTIDHCTLGNVRIAELLVCFALLCRRFRLANRIHRKIASLSPEGRVPRSLMCLSRKIGKLMIRRSYMAGNPLLGLPIHNSFNYVDAKTLGRLAVVYFEQGLPVRLAIDRVHQYQDFERRLLIQALIGLTLADRPVEGDAMKVMIRQIRASGLPWKARRELIRMVKQPGSALAVAAAIGNERTRDFLLEQVILGAVLDGHFSDRESTYIGDLAGWLGVSPESLAERVAMVIDFYQQHKAYLDVFMVSNAVLSYRQRMLGTLQRSIGENIGVIVDQIKGAGELGELLYRASTGEKLSKEEKATMRRQLLDILRSIPSLALFTLPGGAVLLPLVFKYLPPGLKPSGFVELERQKEEEAEGNDVY